MTRGRSRSESLREFNMNSNNESCTIKQTPSGSVTTLTTKDSDHSPHPVNMDIIRKDCDEQRPARLTGQGKIRASRQTKRVREKIRDKNKKKLYTRQVENLKRRIEQTKGIMVD